ncbi:HGxxPAAW family protein [Rothia endophytica]|uniref:HGxxPAAW family protein n=1 Tax=Rothia endophytica TaxID=1324766 RepID=UPI001F2A82CA|nr:HGxxPAAW family protein [Rothia endophytica]
MSKQTVEMVPDLPHTNHGNTIASWAMLGIIIVGAIVAAVGFDIASTPIFVVGVAIMLIGLVAGLVLRAAGYGQGGKHTKYHH